MAVIQCFPPKGDKSLRLNIESISGASNLFLHFNYTKEEKESDRAAYEVLGLLLRNGLSVKYRTEGMDKYGKEDHYKVRNTDDDAGFCIDIEWEGAGNKQQALDVVEYAMEYVLQFDPKEHRYADKEMEMKVISNIDGAKKLAEMFKREIFDNHSCDFHAEHWDWE